MTPQNPIYQAWNDLGGPHPFSTFSAGWDAAEKQIAADEKDPTIRPVGMTLDEKRGDYRVALVAPGMPAGADVFAAPVAAQAQPEDDSIALDRLADYIADTWPMDKKYGLEEICQRLHAMWPGEFIPLEKLARNEANVHEALRALMLYWMRFQKSDGNQQDAYNILAKSAQHAWKFAQSEMERADTAQQPVSDVDHFRDATKMVPAQQPVSGADGLLIQARAALEPFADLGAWLFARNLPDDTPMVDVAHINNVKTTLTRGHFKAAYTAASDIDAVLDAQPQSPGAERAPDSPTRGMNLGQRIAHVGGRENAQGYIEFGSLMAVDALIQHILRDLTTSTPHGAFQARYRAPGGEWSSWGAVTCGVKGREQELRYLETEAQPQPSANADLHCHTDVCHAAQLDGVLCANDECDSASGVRPEPSGNAGELVPILDEAMKIIGSSRGFLEGAPRVNVPRKKWFDLGVALEKARAALAAQASAKQSPIDVERLRKWLSKYGHSTPESLEEMGAQVHRWVNRLLRMEPFQQASGQDREDAERWRWARAYWGRIVDTYEGNSGVVKSIEIDECRDSGWYTDPESLDAAIDAARKAKGEA